MKRCPASFIFDFDKEGTEALFIFIEDYEGKHEYIRRDLIQKVVQTFYYSIFINPDDSTIEGTIDKIIAEEAKADND